jgi:diguanylate cyclase (GGDEF)-like protein
MSFRNRLTSFFVVIVLLPSLAVGGLAFRLISDSSDAKAQTRANGLGTAAESLYAYDENAATSAAREVALAAVSLPDSSLESRIGAVMKIAGLKRVTLTRNGRTILDLGNRTAVAPGPAEYRQGSSLTMVTVSVTTAAQFAAALTGPTNGLVVREHGRTLASTIPGAGQLRLPGKGTISLGGSSYEVLTSGRLDGFDGRVRVSVLSNLKATAASLNSDRAVAVLFIVGFLLLALSFAVLASRGLESQLSNFLRAARRLAGGDFSSPVPVEGADDFAMLAVEFNNMSQQLAGKLDELTAERGRLRESIRRAGDTFASNLDRQALLALALKTAVEAVEGDFGRLSARAHVDGPLREIVREQSIADVADPMLVAERGALQDGLLHEIAADGAHVASVPLGPIYAGRPFGLITVGRRNGRPFNDDDKDLLRSLVGQATLALENVELHQEVARQAVTDELTGLSNHGRFQEVLGGEMEQVRRYRYPVGLIMLDLDNFKQINDSYGHPQGDLVLKHVARVLKDTSREADSAARYGGEEMALILPHTDLEGSYAIAERIRTAIEELRIPLLDGGGMLHVTASLGVSANSDGYKESLIAETDAALYQAKRGGKNRTARAASAPANAIRGE